MGKARQMMGMAQANVMRSRGGKQVAKGALSPGSQPGKGCCAREGREPGGSKSKIQRLRACVPKSHI